MEEQQPHRALFMSFMVILVSEIGDKTFLISAVMAMQYSRLLVFSAAITALLVMTILSALMGQILPSLVSKQYTDIAAAILFFVFGIKLLYDTLKLTGNEVVEEMEEVTQELMVESAKKTEEGTTLNNTLSNRAIWLQIFVMTFFAEWGDRSQISSHFK
jgi:Ca2+/H+ antiporter, TMEM165/GDT1 family